MENNKLPAAMVMEIPKFRAVSSGVQPIDMLFDSVYEDWQTEHERLFQNVLFNCADFIYYEGENKACWLTALKDDVTPADTAPYEIIDFEGGLYAMSACVHRDFEGVKKTRLNIHNWLDNTNFVLDTSRKELEHIAYGQNPDISEGLGYRQLQIYIPIKLDIS